MAYFSIKLPSLITINAQASNKLKLKKF